MRKSYPYVLCISLMTVLFSIADAQKKQKTTAVLSDREYWLSEMDKMVKPVLSNLAHDSLKIAMPKIVSMHTDNKESRLKVMYVEVLGRVLSGIAPWLQLEGGSAKEVALRKQYRTWAIQGLTHALDSNSRDFMRFDIAGQQLVDAAYISAAFMRAPWLWQNLGKKERQLLVNSIKTTRRVMPPYNNWLLFAAMNETFLCNFGYDYDVVRVDYAVRQMENWYVGDGMYSDGEYFAMDYYNSYVIHPFLTNVLDVVGKKTTAYASIYEKVKLRNERYAIIQERMINTDGTYPATGRSIIYRGGAFHHLADMAWRQVLPKTLSPAQVRCALTAVIRKTLESPATYLNGWLTIGLYGSQPNMADFYNNQGSMYICTSIFLPLGLPETDPFWANPAEKWSSQKIWRGEDFPNDHSQDIR